MEGHPFTWVKSRGTAHAIEERLDRALVSHEWWDNFPDAKLTNLLASCSDHSPILLQCDPTHRISHKSYRFRFENVWLKEDELIDVVNQSWNAVDNGEVLHRISNCAKELSIWNKVNYKEKSHNLALHMAAMEAARMANDEGAAGRFF
ncbi:uncharacterized protein LOC131650779 [Vicia villosa]|uniref:uncharacterized protein LOC131650779 n=1 Tax=Vicia villosa TaxID=3911 RepID=UPI00273B7905|nr:uncharacterized protein LOC131650779 [Vicia villosa]